MKAIIGGLLEQIRVHNIGQLRSSVFGILMLIASELMIVFGHPSVARSEHRAPCAELESAMREIFPEGIDGRASEPEGGARVQLIKHLVVERSQLNVPRCLQEIDLLLALLNYDPDTNRSHLLTALKGCERGSSDCDENTAQYVIALYNKGDAKVLPALLRAGTKSDGALSEALGVFYRDTLLKSPAIFVQSLETVNPIGRQQACFLAGSGDGSGTSKADSKRVSESLRGVGGKLSTECMSAFRRGVESSQ